MGNCLFDSLNVFIGLASSHLLRQTLCQYVAEHAEQFSADVIANNYESVLKYVDHMSRNGIDGDHIMICAAAMCFNTKIHVKMPNQQVFTEEPREVTELTKSCSITWVPGHYSVSSQQKVEKSQEQQVFPGNIRPIPPPSRNHPAREQMLYTVRPLVAQRFPPRQCNCRNCRLRLPQR